MKTARFAAVVEAAGSPDVHVLLTSPENDKALQAAIKSHRVMTIHQERIRGRADHGTVGFDPGLSRQFLIFPRSLSQFAGRSIVAIKYDLLKGGDSRIQSKGFKASKTARTNEKSNERKAKRSEPATKKIIPFAETTPQVHRDPDGNAPADLRARLYNAIGFLEQGRHVAALNLLRRIVSSMRPPRP